MLCKLFTIILFIFKYILYYRIISYGFRGIIKISEETFSLTLYQLQTSATTRRLFDYATDYSSLIQLCILRNMYSVRHKNMVLSVRRLLIPKNRNAPAYLVIYKYD
jgi:hypothetical protein